MKCPACGFIVPYDKAPDLTTCNICSEKLKPTTEDILEHGLFSITKEVRPTQVELAKDVEHLLQEEGSGVLLAQGGTGIGKSFAYLIPALLHNKSRVIISTAKKALQSQLVNKDIPYLLKKMGLNQSYTLYKGKSNYACWVLEEEVPKDQRDSYRKFIENAKKCRAPADLSDWEGDEPSWWKNVNLDNCPLPNCAHRKVCKPAPKDSNIVVTNHHLTGIDMRIAPGTLLGEYQAIVFDEAHHVPEAFRSAFKRSVTLNSVKRIKSSIAKNGLVRSFVEETGESTMAKLTVLSDALVTSFVELHNKASNVSAKTGIVDPTKVEKETDSVASVANSLSVIVRKLMDSAQQYYESAVRSNAVIDIDFDKDQLLAIKSRLQRLHRSVSGIDSLTEHIQGVLRVLKSPLPVSSDTVKPQDYLIIVDDRGIQTIPKNIGAEISPRLKDIQHKVIMSATLAVGSDFTYTKLLWGFNDDDEHRITAKAYGSPFDLKKQVKLYLPLHLPLFAMRSDVNGRREWVQKLATEAVQLVDLTGGNAFILFAAKVDMEDFIEDMKGDLNRLGLPLIAQKGDAAATLKKYINTPKAVLFGLKSFWEGVDVPGDKLKLVVIPRLPFPNPYDPIISTMSNEATNGFKEISIPQMIFAMKQGVGRLIRSTDDKGIVAILDARAWTGTSNKMTHKQRLATIQKMSSMPRMGYGKQLLNELGLPNFHFDFTEIRKSVNSLFKAINSD